MRAITLQRLTPLAVERQVELLGVLGEVRLGGVDRARAIQLIRRDVPRDAGLTIDGAVALVPLTLKP